MKGIRVGLLQWPVEIARVKLPRDLFTISPEREWLAQVSDYAEGVRAALPTWGGGADTHWFLLIASELHIRQCAAQVGMDAAALARWIASWRTPNHDTFEAIAGELEASAELVKMAGESVQAVDALKVATGIVVKQARKNLQTRDDNKSKGVKSGVVRKETLKERNQVIASVYVSVRETHSERDAVSITKQRLDKRGPTYTLTETAIRDVLHDEGVKIKNKRKRT